MFFRATFMRAGALILSAILATAAAAQDVYTPPVPIGIKQDGKVRRPRGPIQFPDASTPWIRIRSQHYDVISSAGEEETRDIVANLETVASVLTRTSSRFRTATVPTTILVFAHRRESAPYFELLLGKPSASSTGLYVRHGGGGTMFVDASRRRQKIAKTAMHELVHDLLRQSDEVPPLWIEEGLAEVISTAEIRDGRVYAGQPIREHAALLGRRGATMPLAELFAIQAETDAAVAPMFYAQSWAAVDWLMRQGTDRFFAFLGDVERGTGIEAALLSHFGKTLRELEAGIRGAGSRLGHAIELEGTRYELPAASPAPRAALLYELGRFLSHVSGAEEEAQRFYREALRDNPRHAKSLAATGRFEEAIAAGLQDADVHLAYAETLMTTALGPFAGIFEPAEDDAAKFRKARTLAERALTLGGDEGSARAAIGTSYLVESDVTPGIAHLRRAYELLPRRADAALNLYAMLLRTGRRDEAAALHAQAFENARDKQLRFAAKNVLLQAETQRANALARQGQLEEAAKIVRALAASTDAVGRRELEQQAAQLEATAAVNRHIRAYNEAVTLANTGRNRDAVKVLDQLLAVATDPIVVRDAKKLRDEVRRR
jgi:tetratricopeptide (TPR) repeat protein